MKKLILSLFVLAGLSATAFGQFSIQKVILEEFSGAWCGWCVDGAVRMDQTLNAYQNAIGVTLHNGDPMAIAEENTLASFYITGYPSATVNRQSGGLSRTVWMSETGSALQGASAVTVSFDTVMFDVNTRQITADVEYKFTGPESGDMRINLYVVEDNVTGGANYNQTNYDNTTAGHPYQNAGNPIVGFNHRHVVRSMVYGSWGLPGIITSPVNFGSTFNHQFTYTLPNNFDENEIHLVAVISKHDGTGQTERPYLNGEEIMLITPVTSLQEGLNSENQFMHIYPNPASDRVSVEFSVAKTGNIKMEVLNQLGQQISILGEGILGEGAHTLHWNGRDMAGSPAPNGIYMIRMTTEHGQSLTKRVMLAH